MLDQLLLFFTEYGYFAVFGILVLCGLGLPVPEDITLVAGGVISALPYEHEIPLWVAIQTATNVHIMIAVAMVGVLVGDGIMFSLGYHYGERVLQFRPIKKIFTPQVYANVQQKIEKYGYWVIFFARFMPGLRAPIFVVTGITRKVNLFVFLLIDGFAAAISVPVWVYLGFWCTNHGKDLMQYVHTGQIGILIVVLTVVVSILVYWLIQKRKARLNK